MGLYLRPLTASAW